MQRARGVPSDMRLTASAPVAMAEEFVGMHTRELLCKRMVVDDLPATRAHEQRVAYLAALLTEPGLAETRIEALLRTFRLECAEAQHAAGM